MNGNIKTVRHIGLAIVALMMASMPLAAEAKMESESAARVEFTDSMPVPENTVSIDISDNGKYVIFKSGQANFWNGKFPMTVVSAENGETLWKGGWLPMRNLMFFRPGGLLMDNFKEVKLYDIENGNEIRKFKARYAWHDNEADILIGYEKDDRLAGFKISTGEKIWETKTENKDGMPWILVERIDDENIVYQSNVIGAINLANGEHHSQPLKRSIRDNGGTAAKIGLSVLAGVLTGALTGFAYAPIYGQSRYDLLGSQVLSDGNGKYYVADRDNLMCIDRNMAIVWQTDLPKKSGSASRLYLNGDSLDILNEGVGMQDGEMESVGKPFWATYDSHTGENFSISILPDEWERFLGREYLRFLPEGLCVYDSVANRFVETKHHQDRYPVISRRRNMVYYVDKDVNCIDSCALDRHYVTIKKEGNGYILRRLEGDANYTKTDAEGKPVEKWERKIDQLIPTEQGPFIVKKEYLYTPKQSGRFSQPIVE